MTDEELLRELEDMLSDVQQKLREATTKAEKTILKEVESEIMERIEKIKRGES